MFSVNWRETKVGNSLHNVQDTVRSIWTMPSSQFRDHTSCWLISNRRLSLTAPLMFLFNTKKLEAIFLRGSAKGLDYNLKED